VANKIRNKPVAFSIISVFAITISWGFISLLVRETIGQHGAQLLLLATSATNIAIAVLAIFLLGAINQIHGFKHALRAKGFMKGCLALMPVAAFFILNLALSASGMSYISAENIGIFPLTAAMQATSALMQNVLFRGLLVTALFIKLSATKNERVKSVLAASALYLVIYIPINILNTGSLELMQLVNTFVMGIGFCAAYMYSKNLLSLVTTQGIWQILVSAIDVFGVDGYAQFTPLALAVLLAILTSIVVFAVILSRRAEPFCPAGTVPHLAQ